MTDTTDRQEMGLLLRQRANALREGAIDKEDSEFSANVRCARELESMAESIERGDVGEAPLAESVWLGEVAALRDQLETAETGGGRKALQEVRDSACVGCRMGWPTAELESGGQIHIHPDDGAFVACHACYFAILMLEREKAR